MASIINAATSGGLISTGDTSGQLQLQTAGTTALTISSAQAISLTNALPIASGGTGSTTLAGANIATTNSSTQSITSINTFGFKNRIINGGMTIDQRNAGASVTVNGAGGFTYTLDRWCMYVSQNSKCTIQQNAGSVTPPVGFSNYLGLTSSSAYTVGSAELFDVVQFIEGYNVADLGWGTANAKTVTLSFQVRSSLTGTFGGALLNSAQDRSYPFSYTISAANTWTPVSITITGDTSGTWLTTNGKGIFLSFGVGVGSTLSGTAGAWAGTSYFSATGATSVVGTNGATFYITGVQLEVGTQATSFDFRDYGRELILCQRYYWTSNYANVQSAGGAWGAYYNTTTANAYAEFPVTMRSAPTVSLTAGNSSGYGNTWYVGGITANASLTVTRNNPSVSGVGLELGSSSPNGSLGFFIVFNGSLTASAEL